MSLYAGSIHSMFSLLLKSSAGRSANDILASSEACCVASTWNRVWRQSRHHLGLFLKRIVAGIPVDRDQGESAIAIHGRHVGQTKKTPAERA